MIHPTLADGESFVEGRSGATARALLESAGERGAEVVTTSFGYILPTELVPSGVKAVTNADTAAVITQPGTQKNVEDVWNVGGARTSDPDQDDDLSEDPNREPGVVSDTLTDTEAEADKNAAEARADEDSDEEDHGDDVELFDPSAATIAEVKDYLAGADDVERARVIDAEKASAKPRTGVLELAVTPEGAK